MIYKVKQSIETFLRRESFVINEISYTYEEFAQKVSNIRYLLDGLPHVKNEIIGVITYNDIETYATIYALWFNGLCFLPINPLFPPSRNASVIDQTSIRYIISSKSTPESIPENTKLEFRTTNKLQQQPINLSVSSISDEDVMYILFTSGSTGVPKGVPITRRNLNHFVNAFFANYSNINQEDKFLQMFDFTFDVSVQCYVLPLCIGASIHTVPLEEIKSFSIYKILDKHQITVAKMVPSVIAFLRPYYPKIRLPHLKYSLFSGEALYHEIVAEWAQCTPNAVIQNYYGPTEATIDCLYYTWKSDILPEKIYNGIVTIGKPFGDTKALVLATDGSVITDGRKGELCLSGNQVTTGYLHLLEKNINSFVSLKYEGENHRFYRTGDLVSQDKDGDYLYCGRIDHQVQVQGYRVELGELENKTKTVAGNIQVAAIAKEKTPGNMQIYLFLENCSIPDQIINDYFKLELPFYMQPAKIIRLESFPLTASGKINRNHLSDLI
jgi:amino acid adenylation domain-containing protein